MSSEAELLPCPFCGSATHPEVKAWDDTDGVDGFMVLCSALGFAGQRARGCGAASPWSATPAEAITAWNRRSASPSIGRVTTDGRDGWNNEELAVRVLAVADAVEERFGGLRVTFNEGGVGREGGSMSVKEVCDMLAKMLRTGAPL